jgi:hypothetical protein
MLPEDPEFPALRVEVETKGDEVTAEQVQEAIRRRLASEPTDLFEKNSSVVLLIQHQVGGVSE